jgi:hypothetical protein
MKRSANTSGSIIVGKGGQLGGAGFGGNAGGDAAPPPEATGEQAAASSAAKRKAERKSIATAAAEPINIDQDAAIPPRPNPLAGKSATQVTIKFTLELRDPVGRDLAVPAAPGAEGADGAPAEGENPEGEPK